MAQFFCALLSMVPGTFFMFYSVHRVVPMKHPLIYTVLNLIYMNLLWYCNEFILPQPCLTVNFSMMLGCFLLIPMFVDAGKRLLTVFAQICLITVSMLSVALIGSIVSILCLHMHLDTGKLTDYQEPVYCLMSLLVACCTIPMLLLAARWLRNHIQALAQARHLVWILTIPCSQAFLLLMLNQTLGLPQAPGYWFSLISSLVLCIAADIVCILGYRDFHRLEQLSLRTRQAEHQLSVQNEYYREMQNQILKINQIRHDLKNQLQTAYYLLDQGHPQEVRQQLDLLQGIVQDRVGTRYCENLMVDAVLSEKARVCREKGIDLRIAALVPGNLPVESAHLCSTFSNLLDNAISAVSETGTDAGSIQLRSDVHGNYLCIHCSNPSLIPREDLRKGILRRHGLGTEILSQLAKLYDGSLNMEYQEGFFIVTMTLKIA